MKLRLLRKLFGLLLLCSWVAGAVGVSFLRGQSRNEPVAEPAGHLIPAEPVELEQGYRPLLCALHVHSSFSNGQHEISDLARLAQERKIDVLGITDSFLTRVRYGVGPWKKIAARTVSRKAVLDHGIDKYLASFASAQRQFQDVILLPGLEVAPYYYWQGSYGDDLRLLDFDRHLLIFALRDRRAIRNLPVIENEGLENTRRDWDSAIGPAVLTLSGLGLILLPRERRVRLTYFSLRKQQRFRLLGPSLLLVGGAWTFEEFPFGRLSDPYSGKHDVGAYQNLVDYVRERGGLTFWSYPEARYKDVTVGGARMISTGHPEDLWLVDKYDGFEGIYGDRIAVTQPGDVWDRVLSEYLRGGRKSWPSAITGIDFHYFKRGGWYELNRGQTILWARNKDEGSVLDALRRGRGYAVFQGAHERDLTLRNFALWSGDSVAIAGETIETGLPVTLSAVVDSNISAPSPDPTWAQLELIRDGKLINRSDLRLPIRVNHTETLSRGKHYYRIRVRYGTYEILSNPIFCNVK